MARRGVPREGSGYVSGSHYFVCDRCGFQFLEDEGLETWDGLWVCDDDWERRHPQDFLRIKPEQIAVDEPLRADNINNLAPTATFGTSGAVAGVGEAGRAVAGTDDDIPTATFGLVQTLTNPEL